MMDNKIRKFKKILKINDPIVGIDFVKTIPIGAKHYRDTACTALARVKIKKETVFFDGKKHSQLCAGAEFFLKFSNISKRQVIDVYVNDEQVFKNNKVCSDYLESLPQMPKEFIDKIITIKPLSLKDRPKTVVLFVNPAQASRIIGLLNYNKYKNINIYPNQPTCLAFFAPLVTGLPHLNFIDYYDRYFQGKINKKYIWGEDEMLISLTFVQFREILKNFDKSSQGAFKRINVQIQKIYNI